MDLTFVGVWAALLAGVYFLSDFLEKKAAMRGTNRTPLPAWVEKLVRVFFLLAFVAPLLMLFPRLALPFVLLYLPTYLDNGEKTGKRAWLPLRRWSGFNLVKRYFSLRVLSPSGQLDPKQNYIVAMHPHGFLPVATNINILAECCEGVTALGLPSSRKIRLLIASFCFYIPGYRDFVLAAGVVDAARYNARRVLDSGLSIGLFPGGATEALYAGEDTVVVRKRTGFVKLALETGTPIVPAYSFGEAHTYRQLSNVAPFVKPLQQKFQKIFGLSLPLVTNLIPKRVKITTVVGKPIPVKKSPQPTDEEVKALLETYIVELTALFDAHAAEFIEDPAARKLKVI